MRKRISSSHAKPILDLIIAPEKDIRLLIISFIKGVKYPLKVSFIPQGSSPAGILFSQTGLPRRS